MSKYLIVIENAGRNFSAFCPDLPGCVATGATRRQAEKNLREAISFHIEGLRADGLKIPPPHSSASYVAVP